MRRRRNHTGIDRPATALVLLLPWLLSFAIFWLYPLLYALYLSFTHYATLTGEIRWVGLQNYRALLDDPLFWKAMRNTVFFTVGTVPITTVFAVIVALGLNRLHRLRRWIQSAYFVPSITSLVVLALIFSNLYAYDGLLNRLLAALHLPYPEEGWLQHLSLALPSIMAMDVWAAIGYYALIVLAALQTIPTTLYEAATLSGATAWQQFRYITFPALRPILTFIVILNTIKSLQVFVEIYVMTRGGPLGATTTGVYLVYQYAFEHSDTMGIAAAIAYILFAVIALFALVQWKWFDRTEKAG